MPTVHCPVRPMGWIAFSTISWEQRMQRKFFKGKVSQQLRYSLKVGQLIVSTYKQLELITSLFLDYVFRDIRCNVSLKGKSQKNKAIILYIGISCNVSRTWALDELCFRRHSLWEQWCNVSFKGKSNENKVVID
jgi:hypothetical protein